MASCRFQLPSMPFGVRAARITRCKKGIYRLANYSSYSTKARSYESAIADLNTLQSNFATVQLFNSIRDEINARAIPEMVDWCRKVGYEPSDFDRLNPIHIAGTKGKGSTSTFISSILSQYLPSKDSFDAERLPSDVGLYTSPHLRFVRERIRVNGEPLSQEAFATSFYEIWDRLEQAIGVSATKPSYFRYLTLMAFHHYMQNSFGTAVIECGIGGEYDSTNVLSHPSITGITTLDIDHTAMLGNTIESIAWHKAGIFKAGAPAFTVWQPDSAMAVLEERARARKAELHVVPDFTELENVKLGLAGDVQKINAGLAVAISAAHLHRLGYSNMPDPFDAKARLPPKFVTGLESARLAGRCDERADSKTTNLTWFLDGGHTLQSIQVAGRWFAQRTLLPPAAREAKRLLIFNQQTRDASALARSLFDTLATALKHSHPFDHVIFCTNRTYKATTYKADLAALMVEHEDVESLRVQHDLAATWKSIDGDADVQVVPTIAEAVDLARRLTASEEAHVMVTGSLHLVGGLVEVLESEMEGSA